MRSVARRALILAVAVLAALAVGAGSARATTTCMTIGGPWPETCFDPDTGTGFVPNAPDAWPLWFSGSRAEQLKSAKRVSFWYGFYHEEEYAITCSWGPGTAFIMYRTMYDLAERVVVRNGAVAGWKLLGRDGDARTNVTNTLEWPDFASCTVDGLRTTYDFVRLYIDGPLGGPSENIWRQGEGVCFLASVGNPSAC